MYYDDAGCTSSAGYVGSKTGWGLCKFVPTEKTDSTRVECWTTDVTTDVDVYIYDRFDGGTPSGLLRQRENLSFCEAGYHSVRLNSPLHVYTGNDVVAVVKFTNATSTGTIPLDSRGPSERQRTYMGATGPGGSWLDVGECYHCDVGIRLRTSDAAHGTPTPTLTRTATPTPTRTATPTLEPWPTEWMTNSLYLPVILRGHLGS